MMTQYGCVRRWRRGGLSEKEVLCSKTTSSAGDHDHVIFLVDLSSKMTNAVFVCDALNTRGKVISTMAAGERALLEGWKLFRNHIN